MREKAKKEGMSPVSLFVLMGPEGKRRLDNVFATLAAGTIAPVQIECLA
jgi:hypothetical protein